MTQGGRFDGDSETFVIQDVAREDKQQNGIGVSKDVAYTLDGQGNQGVAHTLRSEGHDASEDGTGRGVPLTPVCFQTRIGRNGRGQPSEIASALTSCEGGTHADSKPHVASMAGVRRLMPVECERLQGFPDDWTRWDVDGNEIADSPRYMAIGNAVTVNVIEWLARRIVYYFGNPK